jgi:sigma-B regulation protein RsbU (phosphoserine phosphatase)
MVDAHADPPIGSGAAIERSAVEVALPPGSTVYLFTDGVVERRGEHLDVGLERLRDTVTAGSPHRGCTRIVTRMMGDDQLDDDFAVLALHVRAT